MRFAVPSALILTAMVQLLLQQTCSHHLAMGGRGFLTQTVLCPPSVQPQALHASEQYLTCASTKMHQEDMNTEN
jgi:hypothetical protein